jgi:hypothetical protein
MSLVIIAVLLSAVTVGTQVLRTAQGSKTLTAFIAPWAEAFSRYTRIVGVVPGDFEHKPQRAVGGALGNVLCNSPGSPKLSDAFLNKGIALPEGRKPGEEASHVYTDAEGVSRTLEVCFMTVQWSVQGISAHAFQNQPRHVMRITGITASLAMQLDAAIDGQSNARFGRWRLEQWANSNSPDNQTWGDMESPNGNQREVTVYFEMN